MKSGLNAELVGPFYSLGDRALLNADGTVSAKGEKQSFTNGAWYVDVTPEGDSIRYFWQEGMWFRISQTPKAEAENTAESVQFNSSDENQGEVWPAWKRSEIIVLAAAVALVAYVLKRVLLP